MNKNVMTESKFKAIKLLLKSGATNKEAAEYMQVSEATACRVNRAETWDDYRATIAAVSIAAKAKKAAEKPAQEQQAPAAPAAQPVKVVHEQSVTIQATHYMMEELRKQNELLTLISNKLAYIVEQLM